jgi:hypothetical protein
MVRNRPLRIAMLLNRLRDLPVAFLFILFSLSSLSRAMEESSAEV